MSNKTIRKSGSTDRAYLELSGSSASLLGTDHYFSGGEGGGEKNLSLQTFFFYLCTSANNFFSNKTFLQTIFFFDLF